MARCLSTCSAFNDCVRRQICKRSHKFMKAILFPFKTFFLTLTFAALGCAQSSAVPPDSPRWLLEGQAGATEYQGRKSLYLNGGAATLKDFEMRDGVIDVDVATPAARGFFGIQFRISADSRNAEWVYLRQHKSG